MLKWRPNNFRKRGAPLAEVVTDRLMSGAQELNWSNVMGKASRVFYSGGIKFFLDYAMQSTASPETFMSCVRLPRLTVRQEKSTCADSPCIDVPSLPLTQHFHYHVASVVFRPNYNAPR